MIVHLDTSVVVDALTIAACALEHGAHLRTLNPEDFRERARRDIERATGVSSAHLEAAADFF
jgi:hypothetical protein